MDLFMSEGSSLILKKIARSGNRFVCLGLESLRTASHCSGLLYTPMSLILDLHRFQLLDSQRLT